MVGAGAGGGGGSGQQVLVSGRRTAPVPAHSTLDSSSVVVDVAATAADSRPSGLSLND